MIANPAVVQQMLQPTWFGSSQTIKDRVTLSARKASVDRRYEFVKAVLMKQVGTTLSGPKLRRMAADLFEAGIVHDKLDRLARRCKDALICWFCEHWDEMATNLAKMSSTQSNDLSNTPIPDQTVSHSSETSVLSDSVNADPWDPFDFPGFDDPGLG
jgi:hypothetical protein